MLLICGLAGVCGWYLGVMIDNMFLANSINQVLEVDYSILKENYNLLGNMYYNTSKELKDLNVYVEDLKIENYLQKQMLFEKYNIDEIANVFKDRLQNELLTKELILAEQKNMIMILEGFKQVNIDLVTENKRLRQIFTRLNLEKSLIIKWFEKYDKD